MAIENDFSRNMSKLYREGEERDFILDIFFAKTRIKRYLYSGPWFLLNSATKATGKCDSQDFCKNNC